MCLNVLDAILENYPKSKKVLMEEIGMETDEAVGAVIPDIWKNGKTFLLLKPLQIICGDIFMNR